MSTPTFKLLLNALRLGQPQDPQAAIFALAEALAAQDDVIDELRRRLQVVQSAAQILETKASRLEVELESLRKGAPYGSSSSAYGAASTGSYAPSSERLSQPPGPQSLGPQSQAPQSHRPSMHSSPPLSPAPHGAAQSAMSTGARPSSIPAGPPSPSTYPSERRRSIEAEESHDDDFKVETVVVSKRDVQMLMGPEAPFRLTPAGQPPAPRGSIPGAPWAQTQRGDVRAPVADDYTVDAHPAAADDEGETYSDSGGTKAVAASLGLSSNDPRVERLRALRNELRSGEARSSAPPPKRRE